MTNDWNHHFSRLRGISRTQRKPPVVRGFANEQTRGSVKSQATHRQRTVTATRLYKSTFDVAYNVSV